MAFVAGNECRRSKLAMRPTSIPLVRTQKFWPEIAAGKRRDGSWMGSDAHPDGCIGILPMMYVEQWRLTDEWLVRRFRQEHAGARVGDGYDRLKVASRLGVVHLPWQVYYLPGADRHPLPGNAGLPEHEGQVTTRGLQEWVCLLPQELPFGTAERLLGWMAHDPEVMILRCCPQTPTAPALCGSANPAAGHAFGRLVGPRTPRPHGLAVRPGA
jgi:hypothetical protein